MAATDHHSSEYGTVCRTQSITGLDTAYACTVMQEEIKNARVAFISEPPCFPSHGSTPRGTRNLLTKLASPAAGPATIGDWFPVYCVKGIVLLSIIYPRHLVRPRAPFQTFQLSPPHLAA